MEEIALYEEHPKRKLLTEIRALEIEIGVLNDEIAEAEKLIHDFGLRESRELGDIIRELLKVKKDKLEREQNGTSTKRREFEQAKQDYEEYSRQYEEEIAIKQFNLSDDEQREMKSKYRRATKLCHPDLVIDELKAQAETIFHELQNAYEQNDLERVTEILKMLESGNMFIQKSEGITEIKKLEAELINLRTTLEILKQQLFEIKNSESYKTIMEITDWDKYFQGAKSKLLYELETLKNN